LTLKSAVKTADFREPSSLSSFIDPVREFGRFLP
jgi:hypothetical protein